jgi:hypothetical protein
VKEAAHVVAHVSSAVKEEHDTTGIAVSTGNSTIENANKMKEMSDAAAIPSDSSGSEGLGKPWAIVIAVSKSVMNEATIATTKT